MFGNRKAKCSSCNARPAKLHAGHCDDCNARRHSQLLSWRAARVEAFLADRDEMKLFQERPETREEKILRVGSLALNGAKEVAGVVPVGAAAKRALKMIDFATKHHDVRHLLGEQLKEAAQVAELLLGAPEGQGASTSDAALGVHYHMMEAKMQSGLAPGRKAETFAAAGCKSATTEELRAAAAFAPFALHIAYQTAAADAQRLAQALPGRYDVVLAEGFEGTGAPPTVGRRATDAKQQAYGGLLLASRSERTAVLAIRGSTNGIDWLANINAVTTTISSHSTGVPDMDASAASSTDIGAGAGRTRLFDVHAGVALRAHRVHDELGPAIAAFRQAGYRIVFTGHSLGGAVTAVLAQLMRETLFGGTALPTHDARLGAEAMHFACYAYGPPACLDPLLCAEIEPFVTSVILESDIVPRASARNVGELRRSLANKYLWAEKYTSDCNAVKNYVRSMGAPRKRTDALSESDRKSINGSGTTKANRAKDTHASLVQPAAPPKGPSASFSVASLAARAQSAASARAASVAAEMQHDLPALYVPGKIIHLFRSCGVCRSVMLSPPLGQYPPPVIEMICCIEPSLKMVADHASMSYWRALCDAEAALQLRCRAPPQWEPFKPGHRCANCDAPCDWSAIIPSLAPKHMVHCNCCGRVVCPSCSRHSEPLPFIGIMSPCTVCDGCFWSGACFRS